MFIEVPFLIAVSVVLLLISEVGGALTVTHLEGGLLVLLLAVYVAYMVIGALRERKLLRGSVADAADYGAPPPAAVTPAPPSDKADKQSGAYAKLKGKIWFLIIITVIGLALVVLGAQLVVDNVDMLTAMLPEGNAKKIISVTVVALGTSLPELVTSVTAAVKGNTGLALGNIIGSNILNILLILGLPALIFSVTYTTSYLIDMIFALGAAALLLVCVGIGKGKAINRAGGILMLTCLGGYLVYLFLS